MQGLQYCGAVYGERSLSLNDKICIENNVDWTSVDYLSNYFYITFSLTF